MHEMLINAASHVEDTHHMGIWLGFTLIGLSIVLAGIATGLCIAQYIQMRKFYKRSTQLRKHLPYQLSRRTSR